MACSPSFAFSGLHSCVSHHKLVQKGETQVAGRRAKGVALYDV